MIPAYDKALLGRAENLLGHMLDFSAHSLHIDINEMTALFISSGLAGRVERGDIRTICGMSGVELAYKVLEMSGIPHERVPRRHTISLSAEYRAGCALARVQHEAALPFCEIVKSFDAAAFIEGYTAGRTAFLGSLPLDISEAERSSALNSFSGEYISDFISRLPPAPVPRNTPLKEFRIKNGLSQSDLAGAAGIPVRTIQQYEQRQKDLGRARAGYLIALSSALHCDPADLLE